MRNTKETCRDLALGKLQEHIETIKELAGLDFEERVEHEDYSEPLSIEVERHIKVLLSWGGPSDYFLIKINIDGQPINGTYHFADRGDHAEVKLSENGVKAVFDFYGLESFAQ